MNAQQQSNMLNAALDYAARSWPVFPCCPETKKPKTRSGFKDATTDPTVIARWWTQWPTAMIGARMGHAAGVFGIDPDVPKASDDADGLSAWHALVAEHGGLPHTHTHRSPSGGQHVLFKWNAERPITNREGNLPPGINVRGEGGYLIVPPSITADGRTYAIDDEFDFFRFADAPAWLLDILDPPKPKPEPAPKQQAYVEAALDAEARAASEPGKGRNNRLNTAAFNLGTLVGAGVLDATTATTRLYAAAEAAGLVAEDGQRAVMATIESGLTSGAGKPRKLPDFEAKRPSERRAKSGDNLPPLITEDEAAMQFAERYEGKLRYCHDHGSWFEWDGSIWKKNSTGKAFHWAREQARALAEHGPDKVKMTASKAAFAGAVERFARSDPKLAVTAEMWDRDPWLLGTPAGTVDLRTGLLRPAEPADGITRSVAVVPAEKADCPLWKQFLAEASGDDQEMIKFIQQWAGYSLTGDTREHALVFVFGPGGNGKSVYVNVKVGILGDYAVTASMDVFIASQGDRHPTDLAMLRGARLVTASETEEGRQWAESRIKQLTGSDRISARFMRQDFFTFLPAFKLTIVGNHKPGLRNVDDAARRRFNLVPFTRTPIVPDRQLEEKLKAEWPGILRWMIDGCLDWQRNGLVRPESIRAATEQYFTDQDILSEWLEDKCVVDKGNDARATTTNELFASWSAYAKAANEPIGSIKSFSQKLEKSGFSPKEKIPCFAQPNKRRRGFIGLDLQHEQRQAAE